MDPKIKKLMQDKRIWAAAGVVGLLGVVSFVRKGRQSGDAPIGTGNAATGIATGPGGTYTQAYGNTTGTDIAGYLGNYQQSLQQQLNAWQQQLTETLATLPQPNPGTGTGGVQIGNVDRGWKFDDWLSNWNRMYPDAQIADYNALLALNPHIGQNLAKGADGSYYFAAPATYRVR